MSLIKTTIVFLSGANDLARKIRAVAAQGEPAWEGMGQKPEVRVWRIEKFKVIAWPEDQYGEVCRGDSYIGA